MGKESGLLEKKQETTTAAPLHQEKSAEVVSAPQMMQELETWELAEGETLEQRKERFLKETIKKQLEANKAMKWEVNKHADSGSVTGTVPVVQPPIQQATVSESAKKQRERQSKLKKVRKFCPVGDENTVRIAEGLQERAKKKDNSLDGDKYFKQADAVHADKRALKVFCRGYRTNFWGRPATEEDRSAKEADEQFLEDYLSGDQELRKPHLDRITQELLSFQFKPEMMTRDYVAAHAGELKEMGDKMVYFENLKQENPDYFAALPQLQRDHIDIVLNLYPMFTMALNLQCASMGVSLNAAEIYGQKDDSSIRNGVTDAENVSEMSRQQMTQFGDEYKRVLEAQALREVQTSTLETQKQYAEMQRQLEKEMSPLADVGFTAPATLMLRQDLVSVRDLIAGNPEKYAENRALIDKAYAEFFKCLDTVADLSYHSAIYKEAFIPHSEPDHPDDISQLQRKYDKFFQSKYGTAMESFQKQQEPLLVRANALKNIIKHALGREKLSDGGSAIIGEFVTKEATSGQASQ
jgi:hypothetical protein